MNFCSQESRTDETPKMGKKAPRIYLSLSSAHLLSSVISASSRNFEKLYRLISLKPLQPFSHALEATNFLTAFC